MTQLIMCAVHTLRRACAVVGEDVACVRGERQRRVGGNDSSLESSSMVARVVARAGALVGLDCSKFVWRGFLDSLDCGSEACRGMEDPICGHDGGDRDGVVAELECVVDL